MTINYLLQVLQDMEDGKIRDPDYIKDPKWEFSKAFRRVQRRIQRLRGRMHYELVEMNRAKVSAVSGHMEDFTKFFASIRNFNLKDCEGLPGIKSFIQEGFQVEDMMAVADAIGDVGTVSSMGYKSITPDYAIMDAVLSLPKVTVDEKKLHELDKVYIAELIRELEDYRKAARALVEKQEEITSAAREAASLLSDLHDYFVDGIDDLKTIVGEKGPDWEKYDQSEKMQIARAIQAAHLITILFPRLVDPDTNELSEKTARAIEKTRHALSFRDA